MYMLDPELFSGSLMTWHWCKLVVFPSFRLFVNLTCIYSVLVWHLHLHIHVCTWATVYICMYIWTNVHVHMNKRTCIHVHVTCIQTCSNLVTLNLQQLPTSKLHFKPHTCTCTCLLEAHCTFRYYTVDPDLVDIVKYIVYSIWGSKSCPVESRLAIGWYTVHVVYSIWVSKRQWVSCWKEFHLWSRGLQICPLPCLLCTVSGWDTHVHCTVVGHVHSTVLWHVHCTVLWHVHCTVLWHVHCTIDIRDT